MRPVFFAHGSQDGTGTVSLRACASRRSDPLRVVGNLSCHCEPAPAGEAIPCRLSVGIGDCCVAPLLARTRRQRCGGDCFVAALLAMTQGHRVIASLPSGRRSNPLRVVGKHRRLLRRYAPRKDTGGTVSLRACPQGRRSNPLRVVGKLRRLLRRYAPRNDTGVAMRGRLLRRGAPRNDTGVAMRGRLLRRYAPRNDTRAKGHCFVSALLARTRGRTGVGEIG